MENQLTFLRGNHGSYCSCGLVRSGKSIFRFLFAHSNVARIFKSLIVLDYISFSELGPLSVLPLVSVFSSLAVI